MANSLTGQILNSVGQPATMRVGVITSTLPLALTVQGASFSGDAVGVLGSYVPALGETVAVVGQSKTQGSDPSTWLILGSSNQLTDSGPVPQVRAWQSTLQSIADSTSVALTFTNQNWDSHGMHSTTVNPSRFTCKRDGRYLVLAGVGYAINATGRRSLSLRKNGAVFTETAYQAVSGSFTFIQASGEVDLVVDDFVEAFAIQFSGVAVNTFASESTTWVAMRWLNASIGQI